MSSEFAYCGVHGRCFGARPVLFGRKGVWPGILRDGLGLVSVRNNNPKKPDQAQYATQYRFKRINGTPLIFLRKISLSCVLCLVRFFRDCCSLNVRAAEHTLWSLGSLGCLSGVPCGVLAVGLGAPGALLRSFCRVGSCLGCFGRHLGGASGRSGSPRQVWGAGLGRIWGARWYPR